MKVAPVDLAEANIQIINHWIEGNVAGDKKPASLNLALTRGISVSAEVDIPENILRDVLKIDPDQFVTFMEYFIRGSYRVGMMGANVNVANALAGIFTATGQDIACVHESSISQFSVQKNYSPGESGGITASLQLPSLVVGTVGGGTALPAQSACLDIMGCRGSGQVRKFAEIIAGVALALELSCGAALAANHFVDAMERLSRNHPKSDE